MDILSTTIAAKLHDKTIEKKKNEKTERHTGVKNFNDALIEATEEQQAADEINDKALGDLLDEVFSLGEKLKKDHALNLLADYRKSIKKLLDFAINNAYQHQEVRGMTNRRTMTQKRHSVVRIIDEKLDRLARAVVTEQKDTFEILGKVNEINGLLVNLWR